MAKNIDEEEPQKISKSEPKKQPQNMAKRITRITRKPQKKHRGCRYWGRRDCSQKKLQKQSKKTPKAPEFIDTDLSKSDTEDGTESDEEVPVAVTSDSDDKQEPIKTAMGKNDTVLRKGIYIGEKTSYVAKIDMKKYLKKMLKLSCTDKETKESIKQFF